MKNVDVYVCDVCGRERGNSAIVTPAGESCAPHQTLPTDASLDSCRYQGCAELWNYISWLIRGDNGIFQRADVFYSDFNHVTRLHGADA
jgi:hypothetical protein